MIKLSLEGKITINTVPSRNFLFDGTVPSGNFLFDGTVPSHNFLFDGTVPSPNFLFDGTVPSNSHYLIGIENKRNYNNYMITLSFLSCTYFSHLFIYI